MSHDETWVLISMKIYRLKYGIESWMNVNLDIIGSMDNIGQFVM
jgi:hypothetical protein